MSARGRWRRFCFVLTSKFLLAGAVGIAIAAAGQPSHAKMRIDRKSEDEPAQAHQALGNVTAETVRSLLKQGHYRDAETGAQQLLAQAEAANGPDSTEAAEALDLLVEALWQGGKSTEPGSRALAERAVALREKTLGPSHPLLAKSLFHLAAFHSDAGDYVGAKPLFERALSIQEQALGSNDPDVALTLNVFGSSRNAAGDYEGARRLIDRGLAIREKVLGVDHLDVAGSLNNLAALLFNTGDFTLAMSLLDRAVTIWEKNLGPDHPRVGLALANLAVLHVMTKDYAGARPLFERSLAIQEKSLGPDHPQVALSLSNLANLLSDTGDYAAAKPLLTRSLGIREKAFGPEHPAVAESLVNLADLLRKTGDYAAATPLGERAVAIAEKALGPDHPRVAEILMDLAQLRAETGDTAGAVETALRAEKISRDHMRLTIRTLGERQALAYASTRASGLDLALTLAASDRLNDLPDAERGAWDALIRGRALVLDEMAIRHRTLGGATDPETDRLATEVASAREHLARLVIRGSGNAPPEQYRASLDKARQEKERAERALGEKSVAFRQEQARTQVGLEEVIASLPPHSALLSFARYERHELSQKRPPGKPSEPVPSYLAFVLRHGDNEPAVVPLGNAQEIEALVARWREQMAREAMAPERSPKQAQALYRARASELRRKIWDPLMPHLRGATRIFVVPDGDLHLINFAALPIGNADYLVEKGPLIHYLSTERDLVVPRLPSRNEGMLVVGAPAFDATRMSAALTSGAKSAEGQASSALQTFRGNRSACGEFRSMRFEPLIGSAKEAEQITALWKRGESQGQGKGSALRGAVVENPGTVLHLSGAEASVTNFRQNAAGKRVIHLATHGFFLNAHCPSDLDSSPKPSTQVQPTDVSENPLLLTGLVFAGANHRQTAGREEDDGILTAEEIAAINLEGLEWAVLSACDTGLGEIKSGEGVLGLRRAFQIAGARTVIMSLWPVEDNSAREWMTTLYERRLVRGRDTAASVREASLQVLRHRRARNQSTHPFYWAGFVAAGDWH
jgi:CHAT domain-containing protein